MSSFWIRRYVLSALLSCNIWGHVDIRNPGAQDRLFYFYRNIMPMLWWNPVIQYLFSYWLFPAADFSWEHLSTWASWSFERTILFICSKKKMQSIFIWRQVNGQKRNTLIFKGIKQWAYVPAPSLFEIETLFRQLNLDRKIWFLIISRLLR